MSAQLSPEASGTPIPVIDVGHALAAEPGALEATARAVGEASESIGFFYLGNHGVPQSLIDRVFLEAERFHTLPLERKLEVKALQEPIGYLPLGGQTQNTSIYARSAHPDRSASFYMKEDYPADHPDRLAGRPWVKTNRWPTDLPGFRETALEYFAAMARLVRKVLEWQAVALGLPADAMTAHDAFSGATGNTLRLLQYPPRDEALEGQFGIGPHTDYGYGSILAQASLPGLEVLTRDGLWVQAPALEGHLLFNNGDMCKIWTNDRYRSAPHRVINYTGRTRYSIPFFVNPRPDVRLECLPTCQGPGNPPRYPPVSFEEHIVEIRKRNYVLPK